MYLPEQKARLQIDDMLRASGWAIQEKGNMNFSLSHGGIETRLSESDYLLQTINQQLIHAESLRQSILQRAFSGEL